MCFSFRSPFPARALKMAELRGFEPLSTGRKPAMLNQITLQLHYFNKYYHTFLVFLLVLIEPLFDVGNTLLLSYLYFHCWMFLYHLHGSRFGLLRYRLLLGFRSYFSSISNIVSKYIKLCLVMIYKLPLSIYSAF